MYLAIQNLFDQFIQFFIYFNNKVATLFMLPVSEKFIPQTSSYSFLVSYTHSKKFR